MTTTTGTAAQDYAAIFGALCLCHGISRSDLLRFGECSSDHTWEATR